jgi:hypothetical protein
MTIDDQIDPMFFDFYDQTVGPYWPPERHHIENGYSDLNFPFQILQVPQFAMKTKWSLDDFLGYLRTWSATIQYIEHNAQDPVDLWQNKFSRAWGNIPEKEMTWPLSVKIGGMSD